MTSTGAVKRLQTRIQSVGKQRNSDGWMLVLEYKLPGSTYETTLYGKDWTSIEGWKPGDPVTAVITRGNLKEGKDAGKEYSFFWDLVELLPPEPDTSQPHTPPAASPAPRGGIPWENQEGPPLGGDSIQYRIQLGMAFNAAIALAAAQPPGGPITDAKAIREVRDTLLREVILVPPAPPHWCYSHEVLFDRTERAERGARYHVIDAGYCIEGIGIKAKEA